MNHASISDYMAHGFCFSWEPGLVWLHVASDILTGLAYYTITAAMGYFAYKRRDVPFMWVFLLFAMFIMACGTTHFFAAYTVYRPDYWPEGYVKAFTALVSIIAAIVFIPKIPEAIDMPSLAKTLEERKVMLQRQQGINLLLQSLIAAAPLDSKLKSVTDGVVRLLDADFCRIWLIRPGDLCEQGCIHADEHEEPHVCRFRDRCLHLLASSGRYTHKDGKVHRRVPFGCYKIGLVASGGEHKFICNDVQNDPRVHNREWARDLGLESFAGYQLRVPNGETLGVLALFAKHKILADEDMLLDGLGSAVALVVQQSVAEEARKQKEKELEEKNAEMERFTYTVSHDLKSPLVTISSFVGYLEMDIKTGDDDRIHNDIGFIRTAADKMGQMLAELLELSRVGRIISNQVQVSFRDVVQETLQLVAGHLSKRNVQVTALDSSIMLYGDRSRLVEIWQNLVENAVKYMGGQKEPRIEIGIEVQEKTTIFFVRDNGIGIDPHNADKIFGLFEKLDKRSEGTGLGLALVKRIVEMYGGRIWVETAGLGHGSCFHFTLPEALKQIEE